MSKINIDKFICSLIERQGVYRNNHAISELQIILGQQGLHYRNGEIVEIEQPPLTEEQKPISRIQNAQACADKDLGLSPYIEWTVPDIDEQNILMSSGTSTKENNKPQTIMFNKERLMEIAKPESIEEKYNINIDKMVEDFKEQILISQSLTYNDLLVRAIAYRNGLEDMLKLIKGGGEE